MTLGKHDGCIMYKKMKNVNMTIRENIVAFARGEVGTNEDPKGSNKTKYGEWFGVNGVAWCAQFVSYIYSYCNWSLPRDIEKVKDKYDGFMYVPYMYNWAKANKKLTNDPKPGDIILFDWQGDGFYDHTGIFVSWADAGKTKMNTVEGNTSADHRGSQDNGDGVYERIRSNKNVVFVNVID